MRTGVNTGEVVAGDGRSGGQRFATGDAVNVAKRLEEAAPANEILLGETTYRLARDAVEVEPVEPLELKGKGEPVGAYRLLAIDPGAEGRARRLDSPMVGREREQARWAGVRARGRERACHLFTVLGAAGVGKSRLRRGVPGRARRGARPWSGPLPSLRRRDHVLAAAGDRPRALRRGLVSAIPQRLAGRRMQS